MLRSNKLLLSLVVVSTLGCEAQKNNAAPPVLIATKFIADADKADEVDRTLTIGTELPKALDVFAKWGIPVDEVVTASAPSDPNEVMREFIVRPQFESNDALEMVAFAKNDGRNSYQVRVLDWHINYDEDFLPKTMRANRLLRLESIDVRVFLPNNKAEKRPSRETNPF